MAEWVDGPFAIRKEDAVAIRIRYPVYSETNIISLDALTTAFH